jgi:hypothetical protein
MKKYFLLFLTFIFISALVSAQQDETGQLTREEKKALKKERKAFREEELNKQKEKTLEIVKSLDFVVESTYLTGYNGKIYMVQPIFNFVSIRGNYSVIQLSFYGVGEYNIYNDFTVEGEVTQFKLDEGKSGKNIEISIRVEGAWISSRMLMTIQPDGHTTIDMNWTRGAPGLTMDGEIKAGADSKVNQSRPINR